MLLNLFLQVTLLATAALSDVSTVLYPDDSQKPLVSPLEEEYELLDDCGPGISVCANNPPHVKVKTVYTSTIYTTQTTTFIANVVLPPKTDTVTEISLVTSRATTKGQRRTTIEVVNKDPLIVTVGRNITTIKSIQPRMNTTTTLISTVYEDVVARCIVNNCSVFGASPTPDLSPAKPSENKGSSPTPTPSNQAKESASPSSSAPAAAKKDADAKKDTAPKGGDPKPAAPKKP